MCRIFSTILKAGVKQQKRTYLSTPDLKENNQGSVKKIITFGHKSTSMKSLPALDVAV